MVSELLKERFILHWKDVMEMQLVPGKKLRTYAKFKVKFEFEIYFMCFDKYKCKKESYTIADKCAHSLIETSR